MAYLFPKAHVITAISFGRDHSLALLEGGRVVGFGGKGSDKPPTGIPNDCSAERPATTPVMVGTHEEMVCVATGYGTGLGVDTRRQVVNWGSSVAGVAGDMGAIDLDTPTVLPGIDGARSVVGREFQFGAVDEAGRLYTWGPNADGTLGRHTEDLNVGPGEVEGLPAVQQVAVGQGYMLALSRDGRLHAWGTNTAGQLGLGHLALVQRPSAVSLPGAVSTVAAGTTHSLAVTKAGELYAWGSNHRGQLGREDVPFSARAVRVALPDPVHAIAAGMHFSLALTEAGEVWAWGWNGRGQLGAGDFVDRRAPARIPGLSQVDAIAAGETHAVALTGGRLHGWGNDASEQIGPSGGKQPRPARGHKDQRRGRGTLLGGHHRPAQQGLCHKTHLRHVSHTLRGFPRPDGDALSHAGPREHGHDAVGRHRLTVRPMTHSTLGRR